VALKKVSATTIWLHWHFAKGTSHESRKSSKMQFLIDNGVCSQAKPKEKWRPFA